ncbi:MAG: hypothetical protein RRY22_05010 [Bacilli bacterium]
MNYDYNLDGDIREIILDFLNGKLKEEEIAKMFNIEFCENCKNYFLEENSGERERFYLDKVCIFCEEDGYGK